MLDKQQEEYIILAQLDVAKMDSVSEMSCGIYINLLRSLHKKATKKPSNGI